MLYELVTEFPHAMIFEKEGPMVSLYQTTHRRLPDNKKDLIVYGHMIKEIEELLSRKYQKNDIIKIMKPFYAIKEDKQFWDKVLDGLAILANQNQCIVYRLLRPVNELAVVAESFHIKPLIRYFQSADTYQLLGLSRNNFALYEGNRYGFEEVSLPENEPRTMKEVLGEDHTEAYLTHGGQGVFHGHGGKRVEIEKDMERYFRFVDRFIAENYSKQSKTPLILVALAEYHAPFRKLTRNSYLLSDGIKADYESLSDEQLLKEAWSIIEPYYLEKTKTIIDAFSKAKVKGTASDDLAQVAKAAIEGRVETVLIEADKIIPGKIDAQTGRINPGLVKDVGHDDILDDLAELVLKHDGRVVVIPQERMPTDTGTAAILRY